MLCCEWGNSGRHFLIRSMRFSQAPTEPIQRQCMETTDRKFFCKTKIPQFTSVHWNVNNILSITSLVHIFKFYNNYLIWCVSVVPCLCIFTYSVQQCLRVPLLLLSSSPGDGPLSVFLQVLRVISRRWLLHVLWVLLGYYMRNQKKQIYCNNWFLFL